MWKTFLNIYVNITRYNMKCSWKHFITVHEIFRVVLITFSPLLFMLYLGKSTVWDPTYTPATNHFVKENYTCSLCRKVSSIFCNILILKIGVCHTLPPSIVSKLLFDYVAEALICCRVVATLLQILHAHCADYLAQGTRCSVWAIYVPQYICRVYLLTNDGVPANVQIDWNS